MPYANDAGMSAPLRLIFTRTSAWPSSLYRVLHEICADGYDRDGFTVHECAPHGDEAFAPMRTRVLGAAACIQSLGEGSTICIADDPLAVVALRQLHPAAPYAMIARPGAETLPGMGYREITSVPDATRMLTDVFEHAEVLLSTLEPDVAAAGSLLQGLDRILTVPPVIVADQDPAATAQEARAALGLPLAARVILVAWESGPDSPVSELRQLLDGILTDAPAARVLLLPIGQRNETVDAFQSLRWMQGRVTVLHNVGPEQEALHLAAADAVFVEPPLAGDGFAIRASAAGLRVMMRRQRGAPSVLAQLLPPDRIVSDVRTAVSRLTRLLPDTPTERAALRDRTLAFAGATAQRDRFRRLVERLATAAAPAPTEPLPSWHPFAVAVPMA